MLLACLFAGRIRKAHSRRSLVTDSPSALQLNTPRLPVTFSRRRKQQFVKHCLFCRIQRRQRSRGSRQCHWQALYRSADVQYRCGKHAIPVSSPPRRGPTPFSDSRTPPPLRLPISLSRKAPTRDAECSPLAHSNRRYIRRRRPSYSTALLTAVRVVPVLWVFRCPYFWVFTATRPLPPRQPATLVRHSSLRAPLPHTTAKYFSGVHDDGCRVSMCVFYCHDFMTSIQAEMSSQGTCRVGSFAHRTYGTRSCHVVTSRRVSSSSLVAQSHFFACGFRMPPYLLLLFK